MPVECTRWAAAGLGQIESGKGYPIKIRHRAGGTNPKSICACRLFFRDSAPIAEGMKI